MVDLTADCLAQLTLDSSLYNSVQALLKEMNSLSASQKVLHTLYYAVFQASAVIPISLYQTVCECLTKLLILPLPYSAVALSTLRSIKMEMITPGSLYQRRVTAEQNLKTGHFTLQEKVFVLADPAVFSVHLEATVRAHLEESSWLRNTSTIEKNVVLHVLQRGLGMTCQSSRLIQALEINFSLWSDDEDLWNLLANFPLCNSSVDEEAKSKKHSVRSEDSGIDQKQSDFDSREQPPDRKPTAFSRRNALKNMKPADKLSLMKEKIEAFLGSAPVRKDDRRHHTARVVLMGDDRVLGRLTRAYRSIRERESKHLILTKKLNLQLYYIPVTDVESSLSPPHSPCQDEGRLSLASLLGRVDPWYNSNINSLRAAISTLAVHSKDNKPSQQNFFLLDNLCYYLRCGMEPVNLPLYSVKMTCSSCDVSVVVEEVFVSHLEADIPEFRHIKEKSSNEPSARIKSKSNVDVFGAFISVSYTKMALSKRKVVKGEVPMTYGVMITSEPAAVTSGVDYLAVRFKSVNPEYNTEIQTQHISIRTMEHRALSVCLDKDFRRTYTDVQRIEISPCLDPGCSVRSRSSVSIERELPLNKYLDKVLSLPINTFTGATI
ncbi:phosphoinositide 3-kinase regulatory subunit 6 [Symphorus nematophorus]